MVRKVFASEYEFLGRVRIAYLDLRERNPGHQLLKLVEFNPDGESISDGDSFVFSEAYKRKFVDPRDEIGSFGYERYARALETAVRN